MTPPTTPLPTPRVRPSQPHALTPKRPSPDCVHVWHPGHLSGDSAPSSRYAVWLGRLRDRYREYVMRAKNVTMSIRRMSLGAGYRYLMSSVARADGSGHAASALTRYYAESGTPPGRFLGRGLAGLNGGNGVPVGSAVSEEHLFRMLGMLQDPITGQQLGRPCAEFLSKRQRHRVHQVRAPGLGDPRERIAAAFDGPAQVLERRQQRLHHGQLRRHANRSRDDIVGTLAEVDGGSDSGKVSYRFVTADRALDAFPSAISR